MFNFNEAFNRAFTHHKKGYSECHYVVVPASRRAQIDRLAHKFWERKADYTVKHSKSRSLLIIHQ